MEERGEASTAGHKRKTMQSLATHNSKIPVAKCAKSMTAKDFDKIHQKKFERSVSYVTYTCITVCTVQCICIVVVIITYVYGYIEYGLCVHMVELSFNLHLHTLHTRLLCIIS